MSIEFCADINNINNMQMISNKIDSESIYLLAYIQKSLFSFGNR